MSNSFLELCKRGRERMDMRFFVTFSPSLWIMVTLIHVAWSSLFSSTVPVKKNSGLIFKKKKKIIKRTRRTVFIACLFLFKGSKGLIIIYICMTIVYFLFYLKSSPLYIVVNIFILVNCWYEY